MSLFPNGTIIFASKSSHSDHDHDHDHMHTDHRHQNQNAQDPGTPTETAASTLTATALKHDSARDLSDVLIGADDMIIPAPADIVCASADRAEDDLDVAEFLDDVFLHDYDSTLDTSAATLHQVSMHSHSTATNGRNCGSVASLSTVLGFDPERSSAAFAKAADNINNFVETAAATASAAAAGLTTSHSGDVDDANSVVFDSALAFRPLLDELQQVQEQRMHNRSGRCPRLSWSTQGTASNHTHHAVRRASACSSITDMDFETSSFQDPSLESSRSIDSGFYDSASSFHSFMTDSVYTETEGEDGEDTEDDDYNGDPDYEEEMSEAEYHYDHEDDEDVEVQYNGPTNPLHGPLPAIGKTVASLFASCATKKANISLQSFGIQWPHSKREPEEPMDDRHAAASAREDDDRKPAAARTSPARPRQPRSRGDGGAAAASKRRKRPPPSPAAKNEQRRKQRSWEPTNKVFVTKGNMDVLMGRGGLSNHHDGNAMYREHVLSLQPRYKLLSRQEKTRCSEEVVEWVKKHGGRFLKEDKTRSAGSRWYMVPDNIARQKVAQALREDHSEEGKALKRAKYGKPHKPKPKRKSTTSARRSK
mmetsp:Transcript_8382/g.24145  ORF Transcript_8382/g.24145 Transcript_8382/m.24145 type:complete len:593 (+) Transcript_8382:619-2397(+)